ncbi:XdhC family protein [Oryzihumus sp.]
MRDLVPDLRAWVAGGRPFALAMVTRTWRSSPRPAGAAMAVNADGEVVGSVSGGCVEGAVYDVAQQVLADGTARGAHYGISGADAFSVGLTCGGELDVTVVRVAPATDPGFAAVLDAIEAGTPVAVATVVAAPDDHGPAVGDRRIVFADKAIGTLGTDRLDDAVTDDARGLLRAGRSEVLHYGPDGQRRPDELEVFVAAFAPRPRMIVFGAIDFARAVARTGGFLGHHVTVCDARPVFATPARFPEADEVVVRWPHAYLQEEVDAGRVEQSTVLTVLTHDPKFDVPLLEVALRSPAGYVGAMGSRRTHAARLSELRERGVTEAELARLYGPIGLDLGSRTPEETAISIAAEVIAARWGGTGRRLSDLDGRIHRDPASKPSLSVP